MYKFIGFALGSAIIGGLAMANPALAQDASSFAGPRIEATVGLDQLKFDLAQTGGAGRADKSGAGYGLAAGYDVALTPGLVAGVEGGVNISDNRFATGDATNGGSFRERRELTLAARLGVPVTSNTLLYGKVGYANQQLRLDQTAAGVTTGRMRELNGVLAGAGVEVKMSPNAYVKSEYRYTNYEDGYTSNKVLTGIGLRF